ncbi:APC family permease [Brevibacterium daeguense]|nr:APC family permease [Brevibacterium daeguense]
MTTQTEVHLKKTLGLPSIVLFGLAYMGPLIMIGMFGVIAAASDGAAAGAMFLATVAVLFTALSYARMARHFPASGSGYTYVRKTVGPRSGFMTGWVLLLDYVFIPLVIWLVGAEYLYAQFPDIPRAVWLIIFIAATTAINIIGIKVADRANMVVISFQVVILALYFILSINHIVQEGGAGAFLTMEPFIGVHQEIGPIASGAAIAAYVFLGYDAVTTLAEETKNAQRTIPLGLVLVALFGGVIFVITAFLMGIILPAGSEYAEAAGSEVALTIGGHVFAAFFLTALVAQQFNAGIAAQASSARLLYAMGRDGVFPKSFFGRLSPRFLTPVNNILFCGGIGLIAIFLSLSTSTSFINFGAFVGFTMVNVAVIAYFIRNRSQERLNPAVYVVLPAIGAVIDIYLLLNLDGLAKLVGGSWMVLGFIYLIVLTRGFTRPTPELSANALEAADPDAVKSAKIDMRAGDANA